MKLNLNLLFLFSILVFFGCKKEIDTSFLDEQPPGFTKMEDYGFFESVINSTDGTVIIAGVKKDIDKIELVKMDLAGNQIWAKNYFEVNTNQMDMAAKREGGMVIMGQEVANILLSSIDAEGNELWTKTLPADNVYRGGEIIQTHDSGFLVIRSKFSSEGIQLVMVRFDSEGNELWNEIIQRELDSEGFNVTETAQQEYLISTKELTPPTANLVLLRVNQKGKILQEIQTEQTVSLLPTSLKTIETTDKEWVMINTTSDGNSTFGQKRLTISKIDQGGIYKWLKEIDLGEDSIAKDIIQLANGDLVVLGAINYLEEKSEILLVRLDKDGKEKWTQTYETKANYYGNEVIQTANGFMVVGYSNATNDFDPSAIILMVDDAGNPM